MSSNEITPDAPKEPDVIPGSYEPTPEQKREILKELAYVCPRSAGHDDLFRYNLTLEGLRKLAKENKKYMEDSEGAFLIRITIFSHEKRIFAVAWPGGLAFHFSMNDAMSAVFPFPKGRMIDENTIPMDPDMYGNLRFVDERLKGAAGFIQRWVSQPHKSS